MSPQPTDAGPGTGGTDRAGSPQPADAGPDTGDDGLGIEPIHGGTGNEEWFRRARRVIPGGVDSPVRSFASVGGTPYTVARGSGAFVWDVEDRRYLDLVQSYGAILLGHAHQAVTDALVGAARDGTTFGAPSRGEVLLAEAICQRVPGCEQVRLVSSGTEATMSAIRVARGFTGRDRVVKFDGCYHGHADVVLAGGGSGVATLGLPGSAGVPAGAVADTAVVPYNQVPDIDDRVACVIVEPVAANMGLVPPAPGFLAGLRRACDAVGALLVFDEVITGFRVGPGGASTLTGVRPDLWCFGKVIGGGLPVGAFGGRRDVLAVLAPDGPVYQAGTLSGNPLATAAGLAVLEHVIPADHQALTARVATFAHDLAAAISGQGLAVQVPVVGPLVGLFFADGAVGDYAAARASAANGRYARFFAAMLRRNVALPPGPYEALFPGFAHGSDELALVVQAAAEAAAEVAAAERGSALAG
ncbi:MAG: glutamate-1-semialdehyde 2,1-aminomutase [Actinomycetota bacterium]|nr:glutamate-1-semialdehyde 2,1-aminomutase [Actinomycetota bacterium]